MAVLARNAFGAALAAALLVAFGLVAYLAIAGWGGGDGDGDRRVLEIRAESAPLIAADVAQLEERRRRNGDGYAAGETLLTDWLAQFPSRERKRMLQWTRYHRLRTDTRPGGFVVRTSSGPGATGFFEIEVDRRARTVSANCGGDPAPGCRAGKWRIGRHGLQESYLLGD